MSYREENGQVILTMSREDYDALLLRLGMAAGLAARDRKLLKAHIDMLDRLNEGNPNYRPYALADAHTDGGQGPRIAPPEERNT